MLYISENIKIRKKKKEAHRPWWYCASQPNMAIILVTSIFCHLYFSCFLIVRLLRWWNSIILFNGLYPMLELAFFTLCSPLKWMLPTALHCTTAFLKNSLLVQEDGYIDTNALSVDTEISSLSEFSRKALHRKQTPFTFNLPKSVNCCQLWLHSVFAVLEG